MTARRVAAAACLALAACAHGAGAVPIDFDLHLDMPPVIADSQAPAGCTVAFLIADTANDDLYAARMRIDSAETDIPVDRRLPCPPDIPPRVGVNALGVCAGRAADPKSCVFADMARGFESEPELRNTAENFSRCSSDKASDIGIACWAAGRLSVCNVGCGNGPEEARTQARARCEEKQQRSCPVTATVPVAGP